MLLNHADAGGNGFPGRTKANGRAFPQDFAAVGRINAEENVHKRCLARAVFTQQRVDRALFDGQTAFSLA
jgi:hypothetical protein